LYQKQREIVEDVHYAFSNDQSLLIEKSREAGITWGVCAYVVWHWLFDREFVAIMTSEDKDKIGCE
jgi:hypothetical protein